MVVEVFNMSTKFQVQVFNGKWYFLLWRKKMKALLIQMKVAKAIDNSYPSGTSDDKRAEADEIAWTQ